MTLISELASYDQQRVERNVTDLLWFYNDFPEAESAARSFLFSLSPDLGRSLVSNERYDSLEILWHLLASFDRARHSGTGETGSPPAEGAARNRLLVIGGYGWGKSSLALVAASFLGLPIDDAGCLAAIAALDPDSGDSPRQLVDKRKGQGCKFTICLKGAATDFHALFLSAVAKSKDRYRRYMEDRGFQLTVPCEYDAAADWLKEIKDAPGFRDVLAMEQIDLNGLLASLSELRAGALTDADRLFRRFTRLPDGVATPWAQQANTADYLTDLVSRLTSPGSPFDGVLVVFDEVGLWVEYANERSADAGVARFLDFMERAKQLQGKLAVCSFIQFDVESFIGRESAAQNVKHISERLGTRVRYRPDLELVFQKAVKHRKIPAQQWQDHSDEIDEHADLLIRTFLRYSQEPWNGNRDRIRDLLVRRCWPIHPLMVAAACHLRFGQGARVLSLLEHQFPRLIGKNIANPEGRLTWSAPVEVVDYFRANFENVQEHTLWDQYTHARDSLRKPEGDPINLVLKAVFLSHSLANDIQLDAPEDFPALVAAFAGLEEDTAEVSLQDLVQSHGTNPPVLLRNENSGWYEFFAMEQNPAETQRALAREFDQNPSFELGEPDITVALSRACPVSPEVFTRRRSLEEHSFKRWHECVLDIGKLTSAEIVGLAKRHVLEATDPENRGVHIIVLYSTAKLPSPPSSDGSVALAAVVKDRCQKTLNDAWQQLRQAGTPVPVALSYPVQPPDELYRTLALLNRADSLSLREKERLGQGLRVFRENELARAKRLVNRYQNWAHMEFLLPDIAGDSILAQILPPGSQPNERLASLYAAVYASRPPLLHSELGTSGNKFVKYCHSLLGFLMGPQHDARAMQTEHYNALQSVLVASPGQEETSWMAVEDRGGTYQVVEPSNPFAKKCYQAFDTMLRALPEAKRSLKELWKKLSVAPYGLDVRSFALLFGVWFARNRNGCELFPDGDAQARLWTWEDVLKRCNKKGEFMSLFETEPFRIRLRDLAAEAERVRDVLVRLRAWDGKVELVSALIQNIGEAQGLAPSAPEWEEVHRRKGELEQAAARARVAEEQLVSLHREIDRNAGLENVADFLRRLNEIERPKGSPTFRAAAAKCLQALRRRLEQEVRQAIAAPYSSLEVEQHELNRTAERLRDLPIADVASAIQLDEESRKQTDVLGLIEQLREAERLAPAKHHSRQERQTAVVEFRRSLHALWPQDTGLLSLTELKRLSQTIADLEAACPAECRDELEDRRRELGHKVNRKLETVRECLQPFRAALRNVDQLRRALEEAERILPDVEGSDEGRLLEAVLGAKAAYEEAATRYHDATADGTSLSRQRDAAVRLRELAEQVPSEASHALRGWEEHVRKRLETREVAIRKHVENLRRQIVSVHDAAAALRLLTDIRTLADGDAEEILPGEGGRLEKELHATFQEIAPVQLADVLRPLNQEARLEAVARAMELLNDGGGK